MRHHKRKTTPNSEKWDISLCEWGGLGCASSCEQIRTVLRVFYWSFSSF